MSRRLAYLAAPLAVFAPSGYATIYLSVEQAQQIMFPGDSFSSRAFSLTGAQRQAIEDRSNVKVRSMEQQVWKTSGGGWFVLDRVLGKHELITYAVGLNPDGTVRGMEILEYSENYGYQVREAAWRKQFEGKSSADRFKLDEDIRNISGATLSCRHVTDGVKRILATYEIALRTN